MMKIFLLITILGSFFSCTSKNILSYRSRPFYKEKDSYQLYSKEVILRQSIRYDVLRSNDEEYAFGATFMIKEDSLLAGKRKFDILSDSVFYFHCLPKHSLSESRSAYRLIGYINFLKWDSTMVVLKERIDVIDSSSRVVNRYYGKRRFERTAGDLKMYFD